MKLTGPRKFLKQAYTPFSARLCRVLCPIIDLRSRPHQFIIVVELSSSRRLALGVLRGYRHLPCRASKAELVFTPNVESQMWQTYRFWSVVWIYADTVKQKPHAGWWFALALAESIHQLLKGSSALDLEEDFIVGIGDFNVEMFGLIVRLCAPIWWSVIRHNCK